MAQRLSFTQLRAVKKQIERQYAFHVEPEEVGMERAALTQTVDGKEVPLLAGDELIALIFRPFEAGELSEIYDAIKDFEGKEWVKERDNEVAIRCLVEPRIPDTAEGRRVLDNWLSGTKSNLFAAVLRKSGMGEHLVNDAKAALGESSAATPTTPSTSA